MKKIIAMLTLLAMMVSPVFAEEDMITVSGGEIETGEELSVVISIPNIPAVIGSVTISYDNKRLEPVDSQFSSSFESASPLINLDYDKNKIKFNWLTLNTGIDFTDCVTITFKGIAGGENEIKITSADFYDIDENKIEIKQSSGKVNVIGEPPLEEPEVEEKDDTTSGSSGGTSSGSVSGGGYSGMNSNKGSATATTLPTGNTSSNVKSEGNKKSFSDTQGVQWAEDSIGFLAEKGIINGVSDTEFAPQNNIKRADYMILLVRMLGLDGEFEDNFDDVSSDKYYYNAIGVAKNMKLTSGVGDNKFNPEKSITRQEMFVMAYRILEMQNIALETAGREELEKYKDNNLIAEYAIEPLAVLVKNNLVSGSDGNISPLGNATRAETAVLIKRLYDVINK